MSNYPSCFNVFYSTFTSSNDETVDPADSTINIFSVASGHLYERFLRIMMLSVLKNTKSPVKFWFLKNYLSPTFKVKGEIIVIYLVHTELLLSSFWYWTDYLCTCSWKPFQLVIWLIFWDKNLSKSHPTKDGSNFWWEVKWMSKVIEHPGVEYSETHRNRTRFSIKSTRFGFILSYNPK